VSGVSGLNWAALARCESGGNPRAINYAGPYYGLYQFMASTWRSVGGSGLPIDASSSEQTYRAQLLYKRSGSSPWPHCGRYL
jgi:soluble lytic murein transglycosylase-like protein